MSDIPLDRRALRQQALARRLALAPEDVARLSASICKQLQQHFPQLAQMRVAFCWPIKNEPDMRALMRRWCAVNASGFMALLPVVTQANAALAFRKWSSQMPLVADQYGILTPQTGAFYTPQALLIPLNAFDAAGYRLGYGGGFFDRTLAALKPAPLSIGVGFELSRVASTFPQAHDMQLDALVTEAGVFLPSTDEERS